MRSGGRYKAECVRRCSLIYVGGSKTQAGKDRVIPLLEDAVPYVEYFHGISQPGGLLLDGCKGNKTANSFRRREYADTL